MNYGDDYELISYGEEFSEDIPLNFWDHMVNWFRVKLGYPRYIRKWVVHKDIYWPSTGSGTFNHEQGGSKRITSPVYYDYEVK